MRRHERHSWPGNVRELASAIARRVALGELAAVEAPAAAPAAAPEHAFHWLLARDLAFPVARSLLLSEFERVFVEGALRKHAGNVSRAASASGLARRSFQIMKSRSRR